MLDQRPWGGFALSSRHDKTAACDVTLGPTSYRKEGFRPTRQNLHRTRISGREWKTIKPGLREVYRQYRKRMERPLWQGDDEAIHKWRIRVKNHELQMLQRV
jgi:hypothetical protein